MERGSCTHCGDPLDEGQSDGLCGDCSDKEALAQAKPDLPDPPCYADAQARLRAGIDAYSGDTGPGYWDIQRSDGVAIPVIALVYVLYAAKRTGDTPSIPPHPLLTNGDEPWERWGGCAILDHAGLVMRESCIDTEDHPDRECYTDAAYFEVAASVIVPLLDVDDDDALTSDDRQRRSLVAHLIDHLAKWRSPFILTGVLRDTGIYAPTGSTKDAMAMTFAGDRDSVQIEFKDEFDRPSRPRVMLDLHATGKQFISDWSGKATKLPYEFNAAIIAFDPAACAPVCENQFGMFCPECGASDRLDVAATVNVRLTTNGTDTDESADGSHTWGEDSPCTCDQCGHEGIVSHFRRAANAA
jgi:hypothetical protein